MTPSDKGIQRAMEAQSAARSDWKSGGLAEKMVSDYVRRNTLFTTDDIWQNVLEPAIRDEVLEEPRNRRVLGAIINSLNSKGIISDSGTTSRSVRRNGALLTVWRTDNKAKKSFIRTQSSGQPFNNPSIQETTDNLKQGISKTEQDIAEFEDKIRRMRANNAADKALLGRLREQGYSRRTDDYASQYLVGIYGGPFVEDEMPDVGDRFDSRYDVSSAFTVPNQNEDFIQYGFKVVLADPLTEEIVYISESLPYDPRSGLAGNNLIREIYARNTRFADDGWLLLPDEEGKIDYGDFYNAVEARKSEIQAYLERYGQPNSRIFRYDPSIAADNNLMWSWSSDDDYLWDASALFDRLYGNDNPKLSQSYERMVFNSYLSEDFLYSHPLRIPSENEYAELNALLGVDDRAEAFAIFNSLTPDEYSDFQEIIDGDVCSQVGGRFNATLRMLQQTWMRYMNNETIIADAWVNYLADNEDFLYELAYDPTAAGIVQPKDMQDSYGGRAPELDFDKLPGDRSSNLAALAETDTGKKYQIKLRAILMASREVRREKDALALQSVGKGIEGVDVDSMMQSIVGVPIGGIPGPKTISDLRDPNRIRQNPQAVMDFANPLRLNEYGLNVRSYYRNISGRRYQGSNRLLRKTDARIVANHAKQKGLYARVIPAKGGHRIYVAKKQH
jgi:hypothetical protein